MASNTVPFWAIIRHSYTVDEVNRAKCDADSAERALKSAAYKAEMLADAVIFEYPELGQNSKQPRPFFSPQEWGDTGWDDETKEN